MADVKERMVIEVTEKGVNQTKAKMEGLNTSLKSMIAPLMGITAAMLALRKGMQILNQAIDGARTSVEAVRAVESRIASTGGAAELSSEQIQKFASEIQNMSNFDDEAVLSMSQLLLTFTKIKGSIFQDAQKVIADMATVMGTDLKSAAIQVGKALQSPTIGLTALRRVGVNFSESQQEVIKSLFQTGKVAEAQALILKELKTEFGGAAQAMARSSTQLKNAYGDLLETIGTRLLPALDGVNLTFKHHLIQMNETLKQSLNMEKAAQMASMAGWSDFTEGLTLVLSGVASIAENTTSIVIKSFMGIAGASLYLAKDLAMLPVRLAKTMSELYNAVRSGFNATAKDLVGIIENNLGSAFDESKKVSAAMLLSLAKDGKDLYNVFANAEKTFTNSTYNARKDFEALLDAIAKGTKNLNAELTGETGLAAAVDNSMADVMAEIEKMYQLNIAGTRFANAEDLSIMEEALFGKQGTEKIKEKLAEVTTAWQEFANDMQNVMSGQVANALNIMILSHESAFAKLQSIMNSFVNAMINELNRYIAKLMIAFLFQSILGIATGGSTNAAALGSAVLKVLDNGGTNGSVQLPRLSPNSTDKKLDRLLNNQTDRPVEVKVYVRPEEISRAAEIGNTLRYITGAS